ncbi:MAG: hypothetical protein NC041_08320 [Bacteroides sp.]|nr:hypothetical protein [Prevotella sp.]MCM1408311.1 hypothetical protein [Treponema brennaborense]MCM1470457.1 hypothetical protein [Bacteroides sp.]
MKILELRNLQREEGYIYYRRNFTADAVIEVPIKTIETPISFSIEMGPTGNKEIEIEFGKTPDYPLVPVIKSLKEFILSADTEGTLPL